MEAFFDIRTSNLTHEQSAEREATFRKRFEHYLTELSDKQQKEVETMWNIDWVRYLVSKRKVFGAIGTIIKNRISIKVLFKYLVFDRINKKCRYYIAKIKCKITHSHEPMSDFYRRGGGNYWKRVSYMFIFVDT